VIRLGKEISPSEITSEGIFLGRRRFLKGATALALSTFSGLAHSECHHEMLQAINEPLTDIATATHYNNFYDADSS